MTQDKWLQELKDSLMITYDEPLEVIFGTGIDKKVRVVPWSMFVMAIRKFVLDAKVETEEERDRFWRGRMAILRLKEEQVTYKKDGGHGLALPMRYINDILGGKK